MIKRIIYKQSLRQVRDAFGAWVCRLIKGLFSVHFGIVGYNNTDEAYQGLSSCP